MSAPKMSLYEMAPDCYDEGVATEGPSLHEVKVEARLANIESRMDRIAQVLTAIDLRLSLLCPDQV